jgi:hypothetical protein
MGSQLHTAAGVEKHKPVGIWIRVSTEDQARGESPDHHEKRARHYAEAKAWKVRELDLSGVAGKSVMECAATKRMRNVQRPCSDAISSRLSLRQQSARALGVNFKRVRCRMAYL